MPETGPEAQEISAALDRIQRRKERNKTILGIVAAVAIIVIVALVLLYVPFPETPAGPGPGENTCLNGVVDEGEEGVDCGGPCATECPETGQPEYVDNAYVLPASVSDIALDIENDRIYVLDELRHRIMVYDGEFNHLRNFGETRSQTPDGGWDYESGGLTNDKLLFPASIYLANGKVFVLDRSPRIQVFSKDLVYEKTLNFQEEALQALPKLPDLPNADGGAASIAVAPNGNIYVADEVSNGIALFGPELNLIKAVSQGPEAPNLPRQISLGQDGRLYVADSLGGRILVYSSELELEETITDNILMPFGVTVSETGTVYVADNGDSMLKAFEAGSLAKKVGGLGSAQLQFYNPKIVRAGQNGRVYVVEEGNSRIQVLSQSLEFVKKLDAIRRTLNTSLTPFYPAVAPNGDIAFSDPINSKVFVLDSSYNLKEVLGGRGFENGKFNTPKGIAFGQDGRLYVSDSGNRRVQVFSPSYDYLQTISHEELIWPLAISVSEQNQVYVVDDKHKKILVFNSQGEMVDEIGAAEGITLPLGILVAGGKIYITDDKEKTIEILDSSLNHLKTIGDIDNKAGAHVEFNESLAFDPEGRLLFCDNRNRKVIALDLENESLASFGSFGSSLQELSILEVAAGPSMIVVADMEQHRVRILDASGNELQEINTELIG